MKTNSIRKILVAVLAFFFACSIGAFALNSVSAEDATRVFAMDKGASIRLIEDSNGIRFSATLSSYDENNDYGFVIVPRRYIESNNITGNYVTELQALAEQGTISEPIILYSKVHEEGGTNVIKGSVTNILYENINLEFVGIGFEYDGTTYNYASFDSLDDISRTAPRVAAACLNELYYDANIDEYDRTLYQQTESIIKNYINESINANAGLTEEVSDVTVPTWEFAFAEEEVTVKFGQNVKLAFDANVPTNNVVYTSYNPAVTVSSDGVVKSSAVGTAIITAKCVGLEDSITVNFTAIDEGYAATFDGEGYEDLISNGYNSTDSFWASSSVSATYVESGVAGALNGDALRIDLGVNGSNRVGFKMSFPAVGNKEADNIIVRFKAKDGTADAPLFLYGINDGSFVNSGLVVSQADENGWRTLTIAKAALSVQLSELNAIGLSFYPYATDTTNCQVYIDYIKLEKIAIEVPAGYYADFNSAAYEELILQGFSSADTYWTSTSLEAEYVSSNVAGAKDGDAMKLTMGVKNSTLVGFKMNFIRDNTAINGDVIQLRFKAKDGTADVNLFLYGINNGSAVTSGFTVSSADSDGWRVLSIPASAISGGSNAVNTLGIAFHGYTTDTTTCEAYLDWVKVVEKVAVPSNFAYVNGTLTWDAVANATSYVVSYDGSEYPVNTNSIEVASGKSVTVKAIASEGYLDSDYSTAYVTVAATTGYIVNYNDAAYESMVANQIQDTAGSDYSWWAATSISATYTASGVAGAQDGDALAVTVNTSANASFVLSMPTVASGSFDGNTIELRFKYVVNDTQANLYHYNVNGGALVHPSTITSQLSEADADGWRVLTIPAETVGDVYSVSTIGLAFLAVNGNGTLYLDYVKVV